MGINSADEPIDDRPNQLLDIDDLVGSLDAVLNRGVELKERYRSGDPCRILPARTLAMVFEKPSTRTRVSFESGMTWLGGHAIMMSPDHMQLGRGEPISDTSRVLSRYVDAILARVQNHDALVEFAEYASVPVVNGLSDRAHPAQTLADLLTIGEVFGDLTSVSVAWVGDSNNVARSFALGCAMAGIELTVASPTEFGFDESVLDRAEALGYRPAVTTDPVEAVTDADVVYTDVWVSMGDEPERDERIAAFQGFQVNEELLEHASEALVMHCLPAHRGEEITDDMLSSDRSLVWEQAENRMHAQNGLLVELLLAD